MIETRKLFILKLLTPVIAAACKVFGLPLPPWARPRIIDIDICGVQPMTGPTGLIFAMKYKYAGKEEEGPANILSLAKRPMHFDNPVSVSTIYRAFPGTIELLNHRQR